MAVFHCYFPYITGCFFARFQKTQGRLQKNSSQFLAKKLNTMEATLSIKIKTQIFLTKISRIYSKVLWIFNKFVEFSKYRSNFCRIFSKKIFFLKKKPRILKKNSRNIPKNSRI